MSKPIEDMTEEEIIKAIEDPERPWTKYDSRFLLYDYEIDSIEYDESRWTRSMGSIIRLGADHYYIIYWERGLTEYQENGFYDDRPTPVHKVTKTITVETWEED